MIIVALLYGAVAGVISMNAILGDESPLARVLILLAAWTWPVSLPVAYIHDEIVVRLERRRLIKQMKERLH